MSFDSDCRSGASPGANPLWGKKRHETVDIWHLTRVSYHSSSSPSSFTIIIVIAIIIVVIITITIIIMFLVYYFLVSTLLLSFRPRCRLVFLSKCRIIFEAKLVPQSLRSVIWKILQILQHSVVQCSWNLAWATVLLDTLLDTCLSQPCLGTCSWEPCLGTCSWEPILRNLLLGALPDNNLFLGTFSWEPVLGNFACLLQGTLLGNLFFVTLPGNLV